MAGAFAQIMAELGYDRYGAQGGDWGSLVSANLADVDAAHVCGLHLNFVVTRVVPDEIGSLTTEEQANLVAMQEFRRTGAGYQEIQGTKPQSLGYGLEDSPSGLAAWIVEKFRAWSDCDGDVERSFTKDQLLANVMLYWVTGTITSSARLYYETRRSGTASIPSDFIGVPTGVAVFPGELTKMPRRWVEQHYNVTHWREQPRGGHFAAMEVPDVYVDELRTFFRTVR
jgi:microsomal epoxide hydrolase